MITGPARFSFEWLFRFLDLVWDAVLRWIWVRVQGCGVELKTSQFSASEAQSFDNIGEVLRRGDGGDSDRQSEDHSISVYQGTPHVCYLHPSSLSLSSASASSLPPRF